MIKDRGNIKWQGMMLTEHAGMLKEWRENDNKIEKPQLDDYELELIADEIARAHKSKVIVKLNYWREGLVQEAYGTVIVIDTLNKTIVLDDPFGERKYTFDEIMVVSLID